jgi:HD superfamily phosphodiesterase
MTSKVLEKMIDYFHNDIRRINHALKVFNFSQIISDSLLLDEKTKEIISYTAILHDIGIKESELKYNSSNGNYQEIEGPPIARRILTDLGIQGDIIDRVCYIIGNHHSYQKIDGMDFRIIVESDFLVNAFEDGMNRHSIESALERIFKTEKGISLLKTMYLT